MRIVQTFWTAGQDPLKHAFGWLHPEYNLMSWALSCLSLLEHYDELRFPPTPRESAASLISCAFPYGHEGDEGNTDTDDTVIF